MDKTKAFLRYANFFAPDLPLPMALMAELVNMSETELTDMLANEGMLLKLPMGALLAVKSEDLPSTSHEDAQTVANGVIQRLEKGLRSHNKVKQLEAFHPIGPHLVTLIEKLAPFGLEKQWQLNALMAQYLMLVGKVEDACEYFDHAIQAYPEPIAVDDEAYMNLMRQTADAETACGNLEQAEFLIRQVMLDEIEMVGHPLIGTLIQLAHIVFRQKDYTQAIELYQQAIKMEKNLSGDDNLIASHSNNLGRVYLAAGQVQKAVENFKLAADVWSQMEAAEHHINRSLALKNLALAYQETHELAKAQAAIEEAIQLSQAEYGPDHPDIGRDANIYALVLQAQGKHKEALEQFRRALRIDTHSFGQLHPEVALTLNNMGALYAEIGEIDKARQSLHDARDILQRCSSQGHPYWQQVVQNIARLDQ